MKITYTLWINKHYIGRFQTPCRLIEYINDMRDRNFRLLDGKPKIKVVKRTVTTEIIAYDDFLNL